MKRELQEELRWQPRSLSFLGSLIVEGNRQIHAHQCQLDIKLQTLDVQEGQEIGAFSVEEITRNSLFSQKWKQHYPISPISAKVFQHFIGEYVHD